MNRFLVFFIVWAILGFSALLFYFRASAAAKRRNHPFIVIIGVAIFLGFLYWVGLPSEVFLYGIPFAIFLAFSYIRSVRFCDACNANVISRNFLTSPKQCTKCGAPLGAPPGRTGPGLPPG